VAHTSRNIEPEFGFANVQTSDGPLNWYRKVMDRGSRPPDPANPKERTRNYSTYLTTIRNPQAVQLSPNRPVSV
jgi:hypothetical protein